MDINDFMYDDEDVVLNDDQKNQDDDQQQDDSQQNEEESVIETFLKGQGIQDIHKIKFEDEDGSEIERDWNSLDRDEQLNILKSGQSAPEAGLDDEEIELINQIRISKMSPSQYIQSLIPVQEDEPHYTVDDISDEELYMLDLQTRIEDITDEQLQSALNKAKEDEDLFKKQVDGIRNEYKQIEDNKKAADEAAQQEYANLQYQQFSDDIINSIQELQNIGELDISMDNEDMERLASFILNRDATGVSYFARALNDPEELVKMAWFALNGEEVLNSISDYYKKQINQISKQNYNKGLEDGKKGKVVIKETSNKPQLVKSIDNLIY